MVADLLEPHQHRKHDALALNAFGSVEAPGKVLDGLAVQRRLPAGQPAQRLDLRLVGQVGDDRFVGFHASQDVGSHQLAKRTVWIVCPLGQPLRIARELPSIAQQARVQEIEDRPQVAQVILDRRSGQRDACPGFQRLCRAGLAGVRILDRLRLVQDDEPPVRLGEHRDAQQRAIAGDHQIMFRRPLDGECLHLIRRHCRRMHDHSLQAGGKFFDLRGPVPQQRGGRHQQVRGNLCGTGLFHQQQRQHLDRLAEAHVVGQAGPEAKARQQVQPLRPCFLVGAQRPAQRRSGIDVLAIRRAQGS